MDIIIKNIPQICCCYYCFFHLLNIQIEKKQRLIFLSAIPLAFLSVLFNMYFPYLTYLFIIFLSFVLLYITENKRLEVTFTTLLLSYGLSYITLLLGGIVATVIHFFIFGLNADNNHIIFSQFVTAFFNILFTFLPFRLKRLRKGMPFLYNTIYSFSCMILGILILFSSIFFINIPSNKNSAYFLFALLLFFIILFLLWQNRITKLYMDKLKKKDIEVLNEVLAQLSKITNTRKGILKEQDLKCHSLTPTNVASIDTMLQYMQ